MAAPTFVSASTGWIVTAGTGNGTLASTTAGNFIIVHMLQDGASGGSITVAGGSNLEDLTGTDNAITLMGGTITGLGDTNLVGNPSAALHRLYCGRSLGGTVTVTANDGGGADVYARIYQFTNVNTGTTFATILENSSAGAGARDNQTGTTVNDIGVTTLDVDRLALNFVAINDDATGLAAFAGETGGDWVLATAIFESSTGTDGTLGLMSAAMPAAATIDGGSDTITSDGWGNVGFALIGTTVAETFIASPLQIEYEQAVGRASVW